MVADEVAGELGSFFHIYVSIWQSNFGCKTIILRRVYTTSLPFSGVVIRFCIIFVYICFVYYSVFDDLYLYYNNFPSRVCRNTKHEHMLFNMGALLVIIYIYIYKYLYIFLMLESLIYKYRRGLTASIRS